MVSRTQDLQIQSRECGRLTLGGDFAVEHQRMWPITVEEDCSGWRMPDRSSADRRSTTVRWPWFHRDGVQVACQRHGAPIDGPVRGHPSTVAGEAAEISDVGERSAGHVEKSFGRGKHTKPATDGWPASYRWRAHCENAFHNITFDNVGGATRGRFEPDDS
jgi:hypothetical protein